MLGPLPTSSPHYAPFSVLDASFSILSYLFDRITIYSPPPKRDLTGGGISLTSLMERIKFCTISVCLSVCPATLVTLVLHERKFRF